MNRLFVALLVVLVVAIAWPPIFFVFVADHLRPNVGGRGHMHDFELQKLLNANRWVIDIPAEKDGWSLQLVYKTGDQTKKSGGMSVQGGTRVVLLARRGTHDRRIEYAWYQAENYHEILQGGPFTMTMEISASAHGSVGDPLASAGVSLVRPDGLITIGETVYRGGSEAVQGFMSNEPAEFEVRVELSPPSDIVQNQTLNPEKKR